MQSLKGFKLFIILWNNLFLVKLQTTVLQRYLIWAPAQISEYTIVFQKKI